MFDEDLDGRLDFREFIVGLSMMSKNCPAEDSIALAFKTFDGGKGGINSANLAKILKSVFREITEEEVQSMFKGMDTDNNGLISKGNVLKLPKLGR